MKQAVILAAGMGSRIRDIHTLPKGFITVGTKAMVEESIIKLKDSGIRDILIITGYGATHYQCVSKKWGVETIFNPNYHCFGSLYSLYCARQWVSGDFLLLESDIFYQKRALDELIQDQHSTAILLSGQTNSGDEVYVQSRENKLVKMGKKKDKLDEQHIMGEFVGINKIYFQDFQYLLHKLADNPKILESGNYEEDGLVFLAHERDVACIKIPDLIWGEVDNADHLARAKQLYHQMNTLDFFIS